MVAILQAFLALKETLHDASTKVWNHHWDTRKAVEEKQLAFLLGWWFGAKFLLNLCPIGSAYYLMPMALFSFYPPIISSPVLVPNQVLVPSLLPVGNQWCHKALLWVHFSFQKWLYYPVEANISDLKAFGPDEFQN